MKNIFALDLGTTKFCIAGYQPAKSGAPSFKIVSQQSDGMKKGMLADIGRAEKTLANLIKKAEKEFGQKIRKVAVGVAGHHLSSNIISASQQTPPRPIGQKNLTHLKNQALEKSQSPGREALHIIPTSYSVDQRSDIKNPLQIWGSKLSCKYFTIESDQLYLSNIVGICNSCGLEVSSLLAEPYASSFVTVPEEQKNMGIAIADIGGGTTDGIVFINGDPISCFSINIGGHMMTNDISIGLNIPYSEAEKARAFFGLSGSQSKQKISLNNVRNEIVSHSGEKIQKILAQRVIELSEHLALKLKPFKGRLGAGILLTGGGSNVASLTQLMNRQFGIPVESTKPNVSKIPGLKDELFASSFATVIGLVNLEVEKQISSDPYHAQAFKHRYLKSLINWVKELS